MLNTYDGILEIYMYTQVYQRLQKVGLSLSHTATIDLVDRLGDNFDAAVLDWKRIAEEKMVSKVLIILYI